MWSFLHDRAREQLREKVRATFPARRIGSVEDIGHAAVFLMTDPYVTGTVLEVSGGEPLVALRGGTAMRIGIIGTGSLARFGESYVRAAAVALPQRKRDRSNACAIATNPGRLGWRKSPIPPVVDCRLKAGKRNPG